MRALALLVMLLPQAALASDPCVKLVAMFPVVMATSQQASEAFARDPSAANLEALKEARDNLKVMLKGYQRCIEIAKHAGEIST
jgi:hypothetical protein